MQKIFIRKNIGLLAICLLILVPLGRWLFIEPLNLRFFNLNSATTSFGQIAGIAGLTLFAINLILSARLRLFDRFFYGLDRVYNYHQSIGAIAFSLLLFHPLFLTVKYLSLSLKFATDFLTPFNNIPNTYGSLSLFLMTILIIMTFYIKLKYHHWKFSHKFMVVAFALAFLHVIFISSDISRDTFLRVYLLTLSFIGLVAGFYQAFLSKWLNRHVRYRLKRINILTAHVVELELEPQDQGIKFIPGQFIFVRFLNNNVSSESHPFSISSGLSEDKLRIVIKSLGDFTANLKNLPLETTVIVDGPYGKFSHLNLINKNQVWIAGGVGITPFISMARSLGPEYDVNLYYCTKSPEDAVLLPELQEIAATKNIRVVPWYSTKQGYIEARNLLESTPDLKDREILLCGPEHFSLSLKQQLLNLNIAKNKIHFENFKLL